MWNILLAALVKYIENNPSKVEELVALLVERILEGLKTAPTPTVK